MRGPRANCAAQGEATASRGGDRYVRTSAAGERTFSIGDRNVKVVRGVRLVRAIPSEVRFRLRAAADAHGAGARPRSSAKGRTATSSQSYHVDPPEMEITGPRSRVARITSVVADPVDLSGVSRAPPSFVSMSSWRTPIVRFLGSPRSGGHRDDEEEVAIKEESVGETAIRNGRNSRGGGEFPLDPATVYAFGVALGHDAAAHASAARRS